MTEFDFTPGQKAFVMGMWGASVLCTLGVFAFDGAVALFRKVFR